MKHTHFILWLIAGLSVAGSRPGSGEELRIGSAETALDRYLKKPDAAYAWKQIDEGKVGSTEFVGLILTSQKWHGVTWKHQLFVLKPKSCPQDCQQGLLLIGGGAWRDELEKGPRELPGEAKRMAQIAEQLKCPIAVLLQVPNQPIFDGKYEDQIIAFTFEKFIRTGKEDWPLLLPMVKSAHRALDATTEVLQKKWKQQTRAFTVTGASKRGWTTWLTGATDRRVNAIAPMVIDVLNMKPQMDHQKEVWGGFSDEIKDYTERGLQDLLATDKGKKLRAIVDPYSYRARLTQPKMIFIGTNDAYWPIDALDFYWDDLQNEKHVVYIPNNGHGLKDFTRVIGSLNGFQMAAAKTQPMPKMNWDFSETEQEVSVTLTPEEKPDKIQIWMAQSETRDFRKSKWIAQVLKKGRQGSYSFAQPRPATGFVAFYGEGIFERNQFPCFLSTNVKVLGPKPDKSSPDKTSPDKTSPDKTSPDKASPNKTSTSK